jgi:hypothetical protein
MKNVENEIREKSRDKKAEKNLSFSFTLDPSSFRTARNQASKKRYIKG